MSHLLHPQIADLKEREEALNISRSFIVQAPAGSGKTSILVQRYLALLAKAKVPEEILAITFTKKAAAQMQNRVLDALEKAAQVTEKPKEDAKEDDLYLLKTEELAQQVLAQDAKSGWQLALNPKRLNIQTIDALCHKIVGQAPLSAGFNPHSKIANNENALALECYRKATQQTLESILQNPEDHYYAYLENLLLHLDNDIALLEKLCVNMLAKREQWLPHLVGSKNEPALRQNIEAGLKNICQENLEKCRAALFKLPKELLTELHELADFAAFNLKAANLVSSICQLENLSAKIACPTLDIFSGFAELLLTKDYKWRKTVTSAQGFPAPSSCKEKQEKEHCKDKKERMQALLTKLALHEDFQASLEEICQTPPPHYTDLQWQIIEALLELLPLLVAQLKVIFEEQGLSDYIEIFLSALAALGNPDLPTDLALNLDYRLQHLLVDEFQDTSVMQYRLLEKLTLGWQQDDGRTLFLVGDPMQSIYRFREAEVGLFLRAQTQGLGDIPLTAITLTTNFRSQKALVNWINHNFVKIMPQLPDIASGAIPFTPSTAGDSESQTTNSVKTQILINATLQEEAAQVVNSIKNLQATCPATEIIAILVRARSHLQEILPALREAGILYQAVGLEKLQESLVIEDLFSLTRALFSLTDRIAWLAILRAPWCGLQLKDLHAIANGLEPTIWQNIYQSETLNLSKDGKARLARLIPILAKALAEREQDNLRTWLENIWLALGGPACLSNEEEMQHAEIYFALLEEQPVLPDLSLLKVQLKSLYLPTPTELTCQVQVMTIHKAKGLEFDHVILPALQRTTRPEEAKILLWQERPRLHGDKSDLLLAPIKAAVEKEDAIYNYLKRTLQLKRNLEISRLLYVAATRAKKSLHLLGAVSAETKADALQTIKSQKNDSFLSMLGSNIIEDWLVEKTDNVENPTLDAQKIARPITRLTLDWQTPLPMQKESQAQISASHYEYKWLDVTAKIIGIIIHRILEQLSCENLPTDISSYIKTQIPNWRNLLLEKGIVPNALNANLEIIKQAISRTLNDERGRWILDTKHQAAQSEFAITTLDESNTILHLIIDRAFIDENGVRWLIDYKTTQPKAGEDKDLFLKNALKQHDSQLARYAKAMRGLEDREIRTALYFPAWAGWVSDDRGQLKPD